MFVDTYSLPRVDKFVNGFNNLFTNINEVGGCFIISYICCTYKEEIKNKWWTMLLVSLKGGGASLKEKSKAKALLQTVFNFSYQINTKCCIESATCCGMESRFSEHGINANCIVWNQERRGTENTACRLMPYADEPQFHTIRKAN